MKLAKLPSVAAAMILFTALHASALAALSPAKIKEMKAQATDVLEVTVTAVEVKKTELKVGYVRREIEYRAKVNRVARSKSEAKPGDEITFSAYRLQGLLPPGPKNPPQLKAGWKGTVFLSKSPGEKQFEIAVFGHSFESATASDGDGAAEE